MKDGSRTSTEALLLGGGLGGLLSGAVAHVVTTLFDRAGGSEFWLKGPEGPPFFNVALFMGVMYGGIAWSLSKRRSDALVGALGPFLGIAVPMALMSRHLSFAPAMKGLFPQSPSPWADIVIVLFVCAIWGTVFALGWRLGRGWKGALGAVTGSFCGYLILMGVTYATPRLNNWPVAMYKYLPTPLVLLDGLLTGAGIGAGVHLSRRKNHA